VNTVTGPLFGYEWTLIGGHLALDLANTVTWRRDPDRRRDRIESPDHLADWLAIAAARHGADVRLRPSSLAGPTGAQVLDEVRRLREATAGTIECHVAGRPLPAQAMAVLRAADQRARAAASVAPVLPWRPQIAVRSATQVVDLLALRVSELCTRTDLSRLRRCEDPKCGWFFLDASRNRSRRWCDPADCGNRTRVRNHSRRQGPGSSGSMWA
jgi:predicted RNA-binding Zn ribbon-like protein